jgi:hypothetical protein
MGRNSLTFTVYIEGYSGTSWIDKWINYSGGVTCSHCTLRIISNDNLFDYSLHVDAKQVCWVPSMYLKKLYTNKFNREFIIELGTVTNPRLEANCKRFSRLITILWWYTSRWFINPGSTPGCLNAAMKAAKIMGIDIPSVKNIDKLVEYYDCHWICRTWPSGEK